MDIPVQVDEKTDYRYFAFVSYSRKDIQWAKWLQKKLEHYMLPSKLIRGHKELPKRIAPVFRDQQDISGIVLEDALHTALDKSRYIILICSPNSARSSYVNEEIRYFVSLGRQDRIIPLIVDGEAFSKNPDRECFPEALRGITPELLGINVREHGKRHAFLRVVSTMLHIHHDEILRRDGARLAAQRCAAAVAGIVLAAAAFGLIWYNTPHSKYYSAYTTHYEVPQGIGKLAEEQMAGISECYRITTQRGKVIRLETVNSQGTVADPVVSESFTDYPRQEFVRFDDKGRPIEIDLYDSKGTLVLQKKLSYGDQENEIIVDFQKPGSGLSAVVSAAAQEVHSSGTEQEQSQIIRQMNTYDDRGLLVQCRYYKNTTGTPACDAFGVYGKEYTYTEDGLIESITNLNRKGEPLFSMGCRTVEQFRYDSLGNVIWSAGYDAVGSDPRGSLRYEKQYEADPVTGNITSIRYYDGNQIPILWNGYHEVRAEYDARGNKTGQRYFGTEQEPILLGECHEIRWEYDENGRRTSQRYFDTQRQPAVSDGYHEVRWEYAENGAETAQRHYDIQREPVLRNGFHALLQTYDEKGNVTSKGFYGTEGEPILRDGYHEVQGEYDARGNCTSLRFFDTQGSPMNCGGYHEIRSEFDDSGNLTSFRYFDAENAPVAVGGCHEVRTEYNENGEIVSLRYFDENREPSADNGYHEIRSSYDNQGNLVSLAYYGEEQQPIMLNGYHQVRSEYDMLGNVTSERYFDTEGKPAQYLGYHEAIYTYDDNGRMLTARYFNAERDPVVGSDGYHELRCQYDDRGNLASMYFFDTSRNPMLWSGCHGIVFVYNEEGELLFMRGYDIHGNLLFEA